MATHTITGTRTKPWHITTANDTWILSEGATFKVAGIPAIDDSSGAGNSDIRILGTLKAPGAYAINLQTDGNSVLFGAHSVVYASTAAYLSGANNTIVNHGVIATTYVALYGGGEGTSFTNSGAVSGYSGFEAVQKGAHIVNEAGGVIDPDDSAIYLLGTAGTATIVNMGKISGSSTAISDISTGGVTRVTNTGDINGLVDLGDGNDYFDSHLGKYSSVAGGDGNDTYILGKGQHVSEAAGMGLDTVKSYASATLDANVDFLYLMGKSNLNGHGNELDNLVYGNKGGNHLFGMDGEDTIGGRAGNDFLTGGTSNDIFVFGKGDQVDTITDYTDGADSIYLKNFAGIASYSDIQPHMSQHGSDVWLSFGHGDKLIVEATTLAELDSTAFTL